MKEYQFAMLHSTQNFQQNANGEEKMLLSCKEYYGEEASQIFNLDSHLCSYKTILVLSGEANLSANFCHYKLSHQCVTILSMHICTITEITENFHCIVLSVSHTFMERYDPAEMIPIRTKYSVMMFRNPVIRLSAENVDNLKHRFDNLSFALSDTEHYFYRQMVLNAFIAFYLDLSNFIEKGISERSVQDTLTRKELIVRTFIELLIENFKREHTVDFYAKQLHLSAHYLTLIVKQVTGKSPSDFIYEMLFGEAKALLSRSEMNVQQVAEVLNFSDQSSFGKFFKRREGCSPFHYQSPTRDRGKSKKKEGR